MHIAQKENFSDFFSKYNDGFKIPIYQRPYSWKKENVETLLQDIENILPKKKKEHFLGLIVLSIVKERRKIFFDYRVPLFCCSASIDSKRALKFPLPKDWAPFL